ncbi:hypothetical protein IV498_08015 [Paenarthrobacter sp. Z7-10]|uniref:hypothetical protein n=1 Tax=Paenarthrobacter sp. Z7-10 TaxID=2787635 RepID=UPI0022A998F6|nr:hypothetical protein [Paenarthrobacter sp. Z7-10]MCZ2403128.1 hypothetical protein [Paenarthrobacter sp. Z7-10]
MHNRSGLVKIAAGWLLGLLLAASAAVITIQLVNTNYFGPQQRVQEYLQALHDGDGAKALGLLQATVPDANAAVLDGEGLKAAAAGTSNVHLGNPASQPDGRVKIDVDYTIDGTALSTNFLLEPTGTRWLFFTSWDLVPTTLPTLDVSVVNETQAALNGVQVNMPSGRNSFAVFYPGRYTAEFQSQYFRAPAVTSTVSSANGKPAAVALDTEPTSALLTQVNSKVHQYLDGCAKQEVLLPAACPFSNRTDNRVLGPINWSVVSYPKINISAYGGKWVLAPLTVTAQVDYKEQQLYSGAISEVKTAQDFGFTAKLKVSETGISVTPVVEY